MHCGGKKDKLVMQMSVSNKNNINYSFFYENILYFFIIVLAAQSANFLESRNFLIISFFYSLILFVLKKNSIDKPIIFIIVLWILINFISFVCFDNIARVSSITFLSLTSKLLMPYFIIKVLKQRFIIKIENIIFYLTLISLPIFLFQLYNTDFFYEISSSLNRFTIEEQKEIGGWYIGFYMFNGWAIERNSGFMWEPGAFAFIVFLAILIRLSINNFKFDFRIFVYSLAIISTFSTMGYIVLFILILAYLVNIKNYISFFFIPIIFVVSLETIANLDFMKPKIEEYYENIDFMIDDDNYIKMNRFGILTFVSEESFKWPIGYGVFYNTPAIKKYNKPVLGANTYSDILLRWGWLGIIIFIFASIKFIKVFFPNVNILTKNLLIIAFLVSVFSNNLLSNPLFLILLYYPYIHKF